MKPKNSTSLSLGARPAVRADDIRKAGGAVASPCIDVCRMNEASGLCEGCLRTLDEIAAWGSLDDEAKREVLARLRERRRTQEAAR
jgi:predicted Fe-S protein YdhL (DUF1289 family)